MSGHSHDMRCCAQVTFLLNKLSKLLGKYTSRAHTTCSDMFFTLRCPLPPLLLQQ